MTPSAFSEISMMSYGVYAKGRAIVLLSIETCLLDFLSSTPSFPTICEILVWGIHCRCNKFLQGFNNFKVFIVYTNIFFFVFLCGIVVFTSGLFCPESTLDTANKTNHHCSIKILECYSG